MTKSWKDIDAAVRVQPGTKSGLRKRDPVSDYLFPDRVAAEAALAECAQAIDKLQDRLWAERTRALLVV